MKELKDLLEILSWFISFAKTFLNAFGIKADFVDEITGYIMNVGNLGGDSSADSDAADEG